MAISLIRKNFARIKQEDLSEMWYLGRPKEIKGCLKRRNANAS